MNYEPKIHLTVECSCKSAQETKKQPLDNYKKTVIKKPKTDQKNNKTIQKQSKTK